MKTIKPFLVVSSTGHAEVVKATDDKAAERQVWGVVAVLTPAELEAFLNQMAGIDGKPKVTRWEEES